MTFQSDRRWWSGETVIARYLRRQKHTHIVKQIWESIVEMIAEKTIDLRPYRHEPRAIKKRPKNFSYLTAARSIFKEIPHRGKPRALRQIK